MIFGDVLKYEYLDLCNDTNRIINYCNSIEFSPDYIVGLVRGGLIPAVILSHGLNSPLIALDWSTRDHYIEDHTKLKEITDLLDRNARILMVDDIVDSGDTLKGIYSNMKYVSTDNLKVVSLICNSQVKHLVDYASTYIDRINEKRWVEFFWE